LVLLSRTSGVTLGPNRFSRQESAAGFEYLSHNRITDTTATKIESTSLSYFGGVALVLMAGVFSIIASTIICYTMDYGFSIPANDIMIAFALGVFQVGLGLAIFTIGSRVVPAAELALLSMTEVLLGPLWVWLFMGETASFYTLVGGFILMLAIAGNALSGLRRKPIPVI